MKEVCIPESLTLTKDMHNNIACDVVVAKIEFPNIKLNISRIIDAEEQKVSMKV